MQREFEKETIIRHFRFVVGENQVILSPYVLALKIFSTNTKAGVSNSSVLREISGGSK